MKQPYPTDETMYFLVFLVLCGVLVKLAFLLSTVNK